MNSALIQLQACKLKLYWKMDTFTCIFQVFRKYFQYTENISKNLENTCEGIHFSVKFKLHDNFEAPEPAFIVILAIVFSIFPTQLFPYRWF